MTINATDLPTTITAGRTGFPGDAQNAWAALNALTALFSGTNLTDRDAVLTVLGLTDASIAEKARDAVGAAIRVASTAASYLTIVPNDGADTITFDVSAGAFLSAIGEPQPIYYNLTTSTWPARTLLPGYTLSYVRWDSQGKPGVTSPPGMVEGDFWDGRRATA